MDYSEIETHPSLNARYLTSYKRDITKFQKALDIDTTTFSFNIHEIIKVPIEKIEASLKSFPSSTCQNMLSALVKYLKLANSLKPGKFSTDVTPLNKLMRSYDAKYKEEKLKEAKRPEKDLDFQRFNLKVQSACLNKKIPPAVRALSCILLSGESVLKRLKLTTLSTIVNYSPSLTSEEPYISVERGILFVKNREEPLSKDFIDLVTDIILNYNCLIPDSKGLKYENVDNASKQASKMFKDYIGESYTKLSKVLCDDKSMDDISSIAEEMVSKDHTPDKALESDADKALESDPDKALESDPDKALESDPLLLAEPASDSDSNSEPESEPILEPTPKPKLKPKLKLKLKLKLKDNVRLETYDWAYFLKEPADEVHVSRVKTISKGMNLPQDMFYHGVIDSDEGLKTFKTFIDTVENANTKVNLLNSLCKFLEVTLARNYTNYTFLKSQLKLDLSAKNSEKASIDFLSLTLQDRFQACLGDPHTSQDLKIVCLLLSEIKNLQEMTTGALRFSDLAKTLLTRQDKYNYLDLNGGVWYLNAECTKNKRDRVAKVSDRFVKVMRTFKIDNGLICKTGKTDQISRSFKGYIGVNFIDVRAAYVTYLDQTCKDSGLIREICENQGHKLSTALEDYRRKPESK